MYLLWPKCFFILKASTFSGKIEPDSRGLTNYIFIRKQQLAIADYVIVLHAGYVFIVRLLAGWLVVHTRVVKSYKVYSIITLVCEMSSENSMKYQEQI